MVTYTCYPNTVVSRNRRTTKTSQLPASSRFRETLSKNVLERVMDQNTQHPPLVSECVSRHRQVDLSTHKHIHSLIHTINPSVKIGIKAD